jgi:spore coat protein CotH
MPGGRGPGGESFNFNAMMSCIERVGGAEDWDAGGPGMRAPRTGHPIKDRFLAAPEFQELYGREYASVYDALFGDGQATAELNRLATVAESSSLLDRMTIETETGALRANLETRAALGPVPPADVTPGTPAAATPAVTPYPEAEPEGATSS